MAQLLHSILPQPRRPIVYVYPDVSVSLCIEKMIQDNIGALVVKNDENLQGIISERDIIRGASRKDFSLEFTKASDVLCANVSVLKPSDSIENAMKTITVTRRHHILVAEDDELIAIVSIGDLVFCLLEDGKRVIEELTHYIQT